MAATHPCQNCGQMTSNNMWTCELCEHAAAVEVSKVPVGPNGQAFFGDLQEARDRALRRRWHEVNG